MLQTIFTLDYEVHGNGEGCPYELMVEPTERLMANLEKHGARLTIFADVAEILKFEEYAAEHGRDDFHSRAIGDQLRDAIRRGHDVQLHLHTSWFNARFEAGHWIQDWQDYSFADLPAERMDSYVRRGKEYLESLLRPVDPDYECHAFRAANWSMQPSRNAMEVLARHGFQLESSVFKWGRRSGLVDFDYSNAPDAMLPWRASFDDVCQEDPGSPIWELPIYAENRWIGAFLSPHRFYRAWLSRRHKLPGFPAAEAGGQSRESGASARAGAWILKKNSWKADFNQCTGRQLIGAIERAERRTRDGTPALRPFVLIGHSKLFTPANQGNLEPFLAHVASRPERFRFATARDASAMLSRRH